MFEDLMLEHLLEVVGSFFSSPLNVSLSLISIILALLVFLKLRDESLSQKRRVGLVYLHLAFLFTPLALMALSISCSAASIACAVTLTQLLLYAIPIIIIGTVIAGFLFLPRVYERSAIAAAKQTQDFVDREAKRLKLSRTPRVYSVDSGKPFAYSLSFFKPRIFMSVGMQEVLSKKELEAVLLHELAHVKNASTWFKFSSSILKAFSPFAAMRNFGFSVAAEEKKADEYAIGRKKTARHLNSAKRKVSLDC